MLSSTQPVQLKQQGGLEWLSFEALLSFSELGHACLTRKGGSSHGFYDSLNLAFDIGDSDESVTKNLQKVRNVLDLPDLVWAHQEHGTVIHQITNTNRHETPRCDGLMTNEKGIALMVKHADCQAALFYDPVQQAIAAVHAGWRGNVQNLYAKTVAALRDSYHCRVEDLHVCIGPSLGPQHAEFINYKTEFPEALHAFREHSDHFDLWKLARWQLEQAGVPAEQISVAGICTFAQRENFFSYRRDKQCGRNASLIWLRR